MAAPNLPVIPEFITVHLGRPNEDAPNVQVPFKDYIKSVASSEIYPTWPEEAIRANIYAQITYALNRIYTEHYRSKGYDFDITNSTQYDQSYQHQREIFDNINILVDELFNDYVTKGSGVEPYFTQYCNGTTVTCPGLSQWGTVDLANKGYTPYEMLTNYYGDDISLVKNAPVANVLISYPGIPLVVGETSNNVLILQRQLNRISQNFPSVKRVERVDGVFDPQMEESVRSFQETFNLPVDGKVGKATWYKIKDVYNAVKRLNELASEGIILADIQPQYLGTLVKGDRGLEVQALQYFIDVISYLSGGLPIIEVDGIFGDETENAVKQFQQLYGLTVNGVVDTATLNKLQEVYRNLEATIPADYFGRRAVLYPGYVLTQSFENEDVSNLQKYLNVIRTIYPSIPAITPTGYFGTQTEAAVRAFQKLFGQPETGRVGPAFWNRLAIEYNKALGFTEPVIQGMDNPELFK